MCSTGSSRLFARARAGHWWCTASRAWASRRCWTTWSSRRRPDGRTLATTTIDNNIDVSGTVQLWDVTDPRGPTRTATIPDGQFVTAAAFSPDGHTLTITTGIYDHAGGTIQLLDVEWIVGLSGRLHAWSCSAADGGLTADEWGKAVPGIPNHRTC